MQYLPNNGDFECDEHSDEQVSNVEALSDFCWLQIFDKLTVADLCNLANVNHQFRRVSMISFAARYGIFFYPSDLVESINSFHFYDSVDDIKSCKTRMRQVLCKFGHLLMSLTLSDENGYYPIEMDAISKYCAGTLIELRLKIFSNLDCSSAMALFESLVVLKIDCSDGFDGNATALFKGCKRLKKLRIIEIPSDDDKKVSDIAQHYPNLKELYIHDVELNLQTVFALLKQNPLIEKLETFNHKAFKAVCLMANELENLEELILRCKADDFNPSFEYIDEIGKLKSIKFLQLHRGEKEFVPVIVALRNVSLEHLKFFDCPSNLEFMDNILELKALKSLTLSPIRSHFDAHLIKLAKQLPLLEHLELVFLHETDSFFTTGGLQSLVDTSPKLCSLAIHTHHATTLFNQKFYDSLLKVIQNRSDTKKFTLTIEGSAATSMVIQMHSNLLHLNYVRKDCSYCSKLLWSIGFERQDDYASTNSFFGRMPYF